MARENMVLRQEARESLRGKWGVAVGGFLLYALINILVGSPEDVGPVLQILIGGPMLLGLAIFSLHLSRGQEAKVSQLFEGFSDFVRSFVAYILMCVFILLWALLLIVPGIIAALGYSQTFYIMAEDKAITGPNALKKSKAMMMGHKMKLFLLGLSFVGWFILGILTAGIGFLWIMPYFQVTLAKFYEDISGVSSEPTLVSAPAPAPASAQ